MSKTFVLKGRVVHADSKDEAQMGLANQLPTAVGHLTDILVEKGYEPQEDGTLVKELGVETVTVLEEEQEISIKAIVDPQKDTVQIVTSGQSSGVEKVYAVDDKISTAREKLESQILRREELIREAADSIIIKIEKEVHKELAQSIHGKDGANMRAAIDAARKVGEIESVKIDDQGTIKIVAQTE